MQSQLNFREPWYTVKAGVRILKTYLRGFWLDLIIDNDLV